MRQEGGDTARKPIAVAAVEKRSSMSPSTFFSEEAINTAGIREYTRGGDNDEIRSVEITEKLCNDLLLRNKELGEENQRLLSLNTKLEKQADVRNTEQDIESKDERIRELNHTIEALWITADELADRKVDLTVRIGKLQNQIKEKHDQLTKNRKQEIADMQVADHILKTQVVEEQEFAVRK
ncbi:uncharacterized protein LOC144673905 isoform X5 [Cetorhinus maximus]